MREIRKSGLMSGDGKRSLCHRAHPRLYGSYDVNISRGLLAIVRGNDILAFHIEMALQVGQDFLHTFLKDSRFVDLPHSL